MGRIIQRTTTITITQTWTIVWNEEEPATNGPPDDKPHVQAVTVGQHIPNTKEKSGEKLQAAVNKTESDKLSASVRKKSPSKARKTTL